MPDHTGNIQPQLDLEEHDHTNTAKRVTLAGGSASTTLGSVNIRNSDGTDNSYTTGGVYGQKVHVVGISDIYAEGTIAVGSSLTGHKPVATGFKDASGNNQFDLGDTTNGRWVSVKAQPLSSTVVSGQVKVAVTGTAVQFPSNTILNGIIISANATNTAVVTLGPSAVTNTVNGSGNGLVLLQGASTSAAISNTNALYLNGTAGDWVSFIAF